MAGKSNKSIPMGGVKSFSCSHCGGIVKLRAPGTSISAACDFCKQVVDLSDPNLAILSKAQEKLKFDPIIPIGRRGTVDGIEWECIGFMVRQDIEWSVNWEEYLFFNPIHGFRWLAQSNGHFSWITSSIERPNPAAGAPWQKIKDKKYQLFEKGRAKCLYVVGEFYWKVKRGDVVDYYDYIAPPFSVSIEKDSQNFSLSLGEYKTPKEIKEIFGKDLWLPRRYGVYSNQPNPSGVLLSALAPVGGILILLSFLLMFFTASQAPNEILYEKRNGVLKTDNETIVEKGIIISGDINNIEIDFTTGVNNSWMIVAGSLTSEKPEDYTDFGLEASYYHGVVDGESWVEGSRFPSVVLNEVKGGKYNLSYSLIKASNTGNERYGIKITRGVPIYSNYLLGMLAIIIPLFLLWLLSRKFEAKRLGE